jgi:hypothetical protein
LRQQPGFSHCETENGRQLNRRLQKYSRLHFCLR